jgi:GTPase SAR1 family protein
MDPVGLISLTGYVMPVGNGSVGKSSVAKVLDQLGSDTVSYLDLLSTISKTKNLEFEFVPSALCYQGIPYKIMIQMLIPPGQRDRHLDGSGRTFDEVIHIYRFYIRRVDVVLLTYSLSDRESFYATEHWLLKVAEICNYRTCFILLGTHLDQLERREVRQDQIIEGMEYLNRQAPLVIPAWQGKFTHLEISNLTGYHINELKKYLAWCIFLARCPVFG